jgi:hypothetical protein
MAIMALTISSLTGYHNEHLRPYIHPALDRSSLIAYLFQAHIYPGKRLDYLGNPVILPPLTKDKDWVSAINVKEHKDDMAAA